MKRGEGKGSHFRERRHVENVLPRCCSRTRAWACKPREFNTLEMSNVEDKMSLGNGVSVCVIRRLPFFSLSLSFSPPISFPPPRSLPLLAYFTLLRISVFINYL